MKMAHFWSILQAIAIAFCNSATGIVPCIASIAQIRIFVGRNLSNSAISHGLNGGGLTYGGSSYSSSLLSCAIAEETARHATEMSTIRCFMAGQSRWPRRNDRRIKWYQKDSFCGCHRSLKQMNTQIPVKSSWRSLQPQSRCDVDSNIWPAPLHRYGENQYLLILSALEEMKGNRRWILNWSFLRHGLRLIALRYSLLTTYKLVGVIHRCCGYLFHWRI